MRRVFTSRGTSAAATGIVVLLLAGGGYAIAAGAGTIRACANKRNGALRLAAKCKKSERGVVWNKTGPQGARGPQGAQGPQGPQGPQGGQGTAGAPAAAQVAGWSGGIGTISTSSGLVFLGPTATVTTTAADPTIVASGSASLATSAGTAAGYVAVCYQASTGGALHNLDNNPGGATENVTPNTNAMVPGVSQVGAPGAGTWKVGVCGANGSSTQAWDRNDWSIGWAMVTAG